MNTTYAGIDYGLGKSNVDNETGIRYGVISQGSVNMEVADDIWQNGRNLTFESYQEDAKSKLRSALSDYFFDHKRDNEKESKLDEAVRNCFEVIEQDLSDNYQSDNDTYLYEQDGYKIQTSETDLWVLKSPYYTHAQFCSPCCPGAGNLDTPCPDGPKTYCLGPEWFDDKPLYPVYAVETGKLIGGEK